jgi:glycosyltransferase involved in cell wall biosynthesis
MQKILLFIPNIERGGIEKNLIILSKYFCQKKYEVEIIFGKISREIKKKLSRKIKFIRPKKIVNTKITSNRLSNSINCFIYLLFKYKFSKDQIIFSLQDHPLPILISKIKKINCIIRIANHPDGSLKFFNNPFIFFIKKNIKKIFYLFASGIVCNSEASANFFRNYYKKKKIVCIYNPLEKVNKIKKILIRKNQIISVGRLQNQKNFYGLIEAFYLAKKKLIDTKLLIIGSGSEKNRLKSLCKKYRISNNVTFLKYQNPEKFIRTSKIFILNSLWEGLPNILMECQNYKIPIISSDCLSGPREILQNQKLGFLVPVNNSKKLAKKIIYVFKNYNLAKNKANLAFKKLYRFNQLNQCLKYEKFLNSIK